MILVHFGLFVGGFPSVFVSFSSFIVEILLIFGVSFVDSRRYFVVFHVFSSMLVCVWFVFSRRNFEFVRDFGWVSLGFLMFLDISSFNMGFVLCYVFLRIVLVAACEVPGERQAPTLTTPSSMGADRQKALSTWMG